MTKYIIAIMAKKTFYLKDHIFDMTEEGLLTMDKAEAITHETKEEAIALGYGFSIVNYLMATHNDIGIYRIEEDGSERFEEYLCRGIQTLDVEDVARKAMAV